MGPPLYMWSIDRNIIMWHMTVYILHVYCKEIFNINKWMKLITQKCEESAKQTVCKCWVLFVPWNRNKTTMTVIIIKASSWMHVHDCTEPDLVSHI